MNENNSLKKQEKNFIIPIVVIVIIMLIIISLSLVYMKYIQNLIDENTLKNLGELTSQDAENVKNKIAQHKKILDNLVNQINDEKDISNDKIFEIFENSLAKDEFSRVGILYEDGRCITSDGEIVDLSDDIESFFSSDDIQLSKSRKSKVDQEEINIYSKKLNNGNENIVILLVIETDNYEKIFSGKIYNGEGNEYIIDSEGIILANSNNRENGYSLFNILGTLKGEDNLQKQEKMKTDIKNNLDGQIKYNISGKYYYTSYEYLNINDWYLIIITPGSAIAQEYNKSLVITFISSIIVNFGILIIAIYIVMSNKNKRKKLYELAYIDKLTSLGNYNYFIEVSKEFLENNDDCYHLIILDIDKFKTFNKQYGRETGDKLLQQIGKKLKQLVGIDQLITRFSNDIFAILLKENRLSTKEFHKLLEKINDELSNAYIDGIKYKVLISIGVYNIKKNENDIFHVLDKALMAHESAKGNYNHKYEIFNEHLEEKILKEHYFETKMNEGLEKGEFKVFYQPKVNSQTGKMQQAEALVRWELDGKLIPPNEFIPLFERNKFIIKLDTYIFEQVCMDVAEWKSKYNKLIKVSINISKEHLLEKNFLKEYCNIARKYNLMPEDLELEITESATIDDNVDLVALLNEIKKAGFSIAIDDFGTGYSSLSILQNMPIDVIKIDKSFVNQPRMLEIMMIIASKLELKTVIEGVETKEQVIELQNLGIDLLQGYYYSRPIRKVDFEKFIEDMF